MYVMSADKDVQRVWYKCKYPEGEIAHDSPSAALQAQISILAQRVYRLDERLCEAGVQLLFLQDSRKAIRFVGTQTSSAPLAYYKSVSGLGLHPDPSPMRSLSGSVLRQKAQIRPNSTVHSQKVPTVLSSRLFVLPHKPSIRPPPTPTLMVDQEAQATDFSEVLKASYRTIQVSKPRIMPAVGWVGSLLARPLLLPTRLSLEGRRVRASPPLRAALSSVRSGRGLL